MKSSTLASATWYAPQRPVFTTHDAELYRNKMKGMSPRTKLTGLSTTQKPVSEGESLIFLEPSESKIISNAVFDGSIGLSHYTSSAARAQLRLNELAIKAYATPNSELTDACMSILEEFAIVCKPWCKILHIIVHVLKESIYSGRSVATSPVPYYTVSQALEMQVKHMASEMESMRTHLHRSAQREQDLQQMAYDLKEREKFHEDAEFALRKKAESLTVELRRSNSELASITADHTAMTAELRVLSQETHEKLIAMEHQLFMERQASTKARDELGKALHDLGMTRKQLSLSASPEEVAKLHSQIVKYKTKLSLWSAHKAMSETLNKVRGSRTTKTHNTTAASVDTDPSTSEADLDEEAEDAFAEAVGTDSSTGSRPASVALLDSLDPPYKHVVPVRRSTMDPGSNRSREKMTHASSFTKSSTDLTRVSSRPSQAVRRSTMDPSRPGAVDGQGDLRAV